MLNSFKLNLVLKEKILFIDCWDNRIFVITQSYVYIFNANLKKIFFNKISIESDSFLYFQKDFIFLVKKS